jgi:Protein of unknown function (DUF2892)
MSFDYKRLVKFEHNIGDKDKKIRIAAGVVLLLVSLFTASVLLLLVGLVLVATGYFGWCPAYSGFEKSTVCCAAACSEKAAETVEEAKTEE